MKIHRFRKVCCDGGRIGRTYEERFFVSEDSAWDSMHEEIGNANAREVELGRDSECRMYRKGVVEGVDGYCNWAYGIMFILVTVEVEQDE